MANSCERAFAVDGLQFTSKTYTRDTSLRAFVLTQISGPALVANSQGAGVVIGKDGKGGQVFQASKRPDMEGGLLPPRPKDRRKRRKGKKKKCEQAAREAELEGRRTIDVPAHNEASKLDGFWGIVIPNSTSVVSSTIVVEQLLLFLTILYVMNSISWTTRCIRSCTRPASLTRPCSNLWRHSSLSSIRLDMKIG